MGRYNPPPNVLKPLLAGVLLVLASQQVPRSTPTLKSNVTIVEVDVVVADKTAQPVRGLRQEDFAVAEDGVAVDIATFSAIDIPSAPVTAEAPAPDRSGSAFASNDRRDDGRLILIVLDDVQSGLESGENGDRRADRAARRGAAWSDGSGRRHDDERTARHRRGVHDRPGAAGRRDRSLHAATRARTAGDCR